LQSELRPGQFVLVSAKVGKSARHQRFQAQLPATLIDHGLEEMLKKGVYSSIYNCFQNC